MTNHAAEARGWTERAWQRMSGDDLDRPLLRVDSQREQMLSTAQVHATLALADEQRTANLIAWLAMRSTDGIVASDTDVFLDVAARLGLTPTTPNQEQ